MSNVVNAWLHTANNHMGIFDTGFDAKAFIEGTCADADEATPGDDTVSSASPVAYGNTSCPSNEVDGLEAHHLWIGFFLQVWQVLSLPGISVLSRLLLLCTEWPRAPGKCHKA